MKIDCKIKSILEARSGLKKDNTTYWYSQKIEVEWQEAKTRNDGTIYAVDQSLIVQLFGDMAKNFTLTVGQSITLDIHFECHEYQGKKFNDVSSSFLIMR